MWIYIIQVAIKVYPKYCHDFYVIKQNTDRSTYHLYSFEL